MEDKWKYKVALLEDRYARVKDRTRIFLKLISMPVIGLSKLFFEDSKHLYPPLSIQSNLINNKMNNIESFDYASKDWSHNIDGQLA